VRMLEGAGIRADVAGTGQEAIDMLRLMHYDLVLMDCQMPVMGGHQAVAEIRRNQGAGRHTPVVSMRTGGETDCALVCTDCGMDDILEKPVRLNKLLQVVKRWVPQAQIPAENVGRS